MYVVDLPGSGQSYIPHDFDLCSDFMDAEQKMSERCVENQLTAPERNIVGGTAAWPTAGLHNKWPGVSSISYSEVLNQYISNNAIDWPAW